MYTNHGSYWFILHLFCVLLFGAFGPVSFAQDDSAGDLTVVVLQGAGEFVNIQKCCESRTIMVEVRDEEGRRVQNAMVTFTLPSRGPGAIFPQNARSVFVRADERGRATAAGLRHNGVLGQFLIRIVASSQGRSGRTMVTQNNATLARRDVTFIRDQATEQTTSGFVISQKEAERAKGFKWKKWIIIGGIAGGAAIGYFKYKPFGGSGNTVGISIGNPTIGGPTIGGP